jgi:hypothetical protein
MKYIFTLAAFLFSQLVFAQKNAHSIAFMGGIPIKNSKYDFSLPLTFEYEYRRGKSGFSVGLQGELSVSNFSNIKNQSVSDFEKICQDKIIAYYAGGSGFYNRPYCVYFHKAKDVYINLPLTYTFYCWSKKNLNVFLKAGSMINFAAWKMRIFEYKELDNKGNFLNPLPLVSNNTNKTFHYDGYHGILDVGANYRINKKTKLIGHLQYQHEFFDFPPKTNNTHKVFLHLGASLKI